MPLRLSLLCLAALTLGVSAPHAQPIESEWAAYTSMNELTDILVDGLDVWATTTGGVLNYNRALRRYRRFTQLEGLAGNQVRSVTADSSGSLWFGTAGQGLSRFHRSTNTFDPAFLEFRDLSILSLLAKGNRLYVGTSEGISVFLIDREEVKESYRRLGNLAKDTEVTSLEIHDGVLFAGTPDGVAWARLDQANLQDPDSWRSKANTGPVLDMVAANGLVHAGSLIGVFTYDAAVDDFYHDFSSRGVSAMGALNGAGIAATVAGDFVLRQGRGSWQRIGAPIIDNVTAASRAGGSHLWLGTTRGLRVVGVNAPVLPPSGEPGSSRFYEIALVGEDELWAASVPDDQQRTLSAGAYRLADDSWTVYDRSTGMPNDELVALETDRDGRLWIGTWGGGVSMFDTNERWVNINRDRSVLRGVSPSSPAFVVISDIQRDTDGNMWLLNVLAGVAVLDNFPPSRQLLIDQASLGLDETVDFYRLAIGPDGLKWIASRTHGLILLDDGGTPFTKGDDRFIVVDQDIEPRLTSKRISGVHVDAAGNVWMATDSGLNVLTPDYDRAAGELRRTAWRTYSTFDGLLSSEINTIESDDDGNIWVGTEGGLSRIGADGELDFTLTRSNSGLIDNRVKGLTFDSRRGEMWIGTFDGLNRLRVIASEVTEGPEGFSVYPNPFVTAGRTHLTFTGLPLGAAVRIFTVAGETVSALQADAGRATLTWDGQNESGFLVASGIYYYIAVGESGDRTLGRFAVVNGAP